MNQSSTGLSENVAGALCYSLLWITGLIFLLVERSSGYVRFHAMQSLLVFGLISVAGVVVQLLPGVGAFLGGVLGLLAVVLWIVLMVKAWQGERFKLPLIGDEAERQAARMAP
ncbi:MAG TPA: DUF4870 domain-containing protein [Candidatus Krumholzibacteria bacterium]|nr:DUF4870 domain-containing protein [Candidatus Krumholzibacteria bacterium]HPD70664.1 DUF4870 domain-containing protein [Candidatus Krumholzibacteria bacterium]HRY39636.1 DUF4870 domain-containing protein [Candidatus Krumholzibacteria bacterium]